MEELFRAVREACTGNNWSRGVELSRTGQVIGESITEDEAVFRIDSRSGMASPTVILYLDDNEWECDCPDRSGACHHVAAAVIALKRAREAGEELPEPEHRPGQITYRLFRGEGGLWFERGVATDNGYEVVEATLAAIGSGRAKGPRFLATKEDLAVDVAVGTWRSGLVPRQEVQRLLAALSMCKNVKFEDRPVTASSTEIMPVVRLQKLDNGYRLKLVENPAIQERFDNGVVLLDDTLHPAGVPTLTGRELHELSSGKVYPAGSVPELVGEVLPSLKKRIPVEPVDGGIPEAVDERPRMVVQTSSDGGTLSVLASLVYGDPPLARVEAGRLVPLGDAIPRRDEDRERKLVGHLGRVLGIAPGIREHFRDMAAVLFTEKLESYRGNVEGEGHHTFRKAPPLEPLFEVSGNDFRLDFTVAGESGGRRDPDPSTVIGAWRNGWSMAPLPDGGWSPLPSDWLARYGHMVADLLAARGDGGNLPPCLVPDLARLCRDLGEPAPPEFDRLRSLMDGFDGVPPAELPVDLTADLRPYQVLGVNWLCFLGKAGLGAMLADDMGLGKTLQALCAVRGRTLVAAPTSVVHNWSAEAARFRPSLRLCMYHGPNRKLDPEADLTITSYALLRLDIDRLSSVFWDTVVLDEAQAIKNPGSQVAGAAYRIRAGFRISLSGTPVENRLDELWSQFNFINPGLLGSLDDFQERYVRPILEDDPTASARLRQRIRPFLLRRMKSEVAPELPPRSNVVLRCELEERERSVYDAIRAATLEEVVRKLQAGGTVMAAFESLLRLRQASCHAGLVPGNEAESSSKTELLMTCLESVAADGHKALVFSQWTSLLDLLEPHLEGAGIDFLRLDGSTRDRSGVVDGFQSKQGPPVLLLSLKAGGTGLNLTAADHVFLMDPWWNPAVEEQAADRAHRIGQDRPVLVYRLVAAETVEERILALQEKKRELARLATGEAGQAIGITRGDLIALLE